jgi:ferritin-like metal-binding protein YciE
MLDALPEPGSRKGDALREAFIEHRARAKEQVERLREIFLTGTRAERPTGHGVAAQRRRGRRGKRAKRRKRDVADA